MQVSERYVVSIYFFLLNNNLRFRWLWNTLAHGSIRTFVDTFREYITSAIRNIIVSVTRTDRRDYDDRIWNKVKNVMEKGICTPLHHIVTFLWYLFTRLKYSRHILIIVTHRGWLDYTLEEIDTHVRSRSLILIVSMEKYWHIRLYSDVSFPLKLQILVWVALSES